MWSAPASPSVQEGLAVGADIDFQLLARGAFSFESETDRIRISGLIDRFHFAWAEILHLGLQRVHYGLRDFLLGNAMLLHFHNPPRAGDLQLHAIAACVCALYLEEGMVASG